METIISKQFTLQARDFLRGLIIAVVAPVITVIQQSITADELIFNWKAIGVTALSAGLAYLAKNFFEPTKEIEIKTQEKKS